VRDAAALLDAVTGPDLGAPYWAPPPDRPFLSEVGVDPGRLRIAFSAEPFLPAQIHDDCVRGLGQTVALLQDLGHEVEEAAPGVDGHALLQAFETMAFAETRAAIAEAEAVLGRRATVAVFEPATWAAGLIGEAIPAPKLSWALHQLKRTSRQVAPFFEQYDVLLTPTLACPPLEVGVLRIGGAKRLGLVALNHLGTGRLLKALARVTGAGLRMLSFAPFTPLFNATGQPAMSVPLCWNEEGLPIGMQFAGRYGDEATLFRLAAQLEKASPWFHRVPPVCGRLRPGSE
jgi:amidase